MQEELEVRRARRRAWAKANPEKVRAYEKSPNQRRRRAAAKRRLRATDPAWREREHAKQKAYRAQPDRKVRAQFYLAQWRARKSGAAGVDYCSLDKFEARRSLYGFRCAYCGAPDAPHVDHVIPLCRGGSAFPSNLVPACSSCNRRNNWRTPREFGLAPTLSPVGVAA